MQLIAKFTQTLPIQTGIGKNGKWKKQDIIVEIAGDSANNVSPCGVIKSMKSYYKLGVFYKLTMVLKAVNTTSDILTSGQNN